jgi:hypothetical protein
MTKPKWLKITWFWFAIGLVAVMVAATAWLVCWPTAEQRAFRSIQPGMTKEQVRDTLGVQQGSPSDFFCGGGSTREGWGKQLQQNCWWRLRNGVVYVSFDENARVVGAELVDFNAGESLLTLLRWLLGL